MRECGRSGENTAYTKEFIKKFERQGKFLDKQKKAYYSKYKLKKAKGYDKEEYA